MNQPDGKVWAGGNFDSMGRQPRNNLSPLNPDGTLDTSFSFGTDEMINRLVIQLVKFVNSQRIPLLRHFMKEILL